MSENIGAREQAEVNAIANDSMPDNHDARTGFDSGWRSRDAEVAALTAQLGEAEERAVRLAGRLALTQIDRDKERDRLQAAQATIASVRELGEAILRESHCGHLGRDVLALVSDGAYGKVKSDAAPGE